MEKKAVWLSKVEKSLGRIAEAYDYCDAESGDYVYTRVVFASGEERAYYKCSEDYARAGYGGYEEYSVFSPCFQELGEAGRIYLCQREKDAIAIRRTGLASMCLYKVSAPKEERLVGKFLALIENKEIVVCPSGDRDSGQWKKKVEGNILKGREHFVLDSEGDIPVLAEEGREAVEARVKETVIPLPSEINSLADGYGVGLIDMSKPMTLQKNANGSLAQTTLNAMEILMKDESFSKLRIRYDSLAELIEISGLPSNSRMHELTETDVLNIKARMETYGFRSKNELYEALMMIAEEHSYHPIIDYLENLPDWDGIDRYSDFFPKYLGAERCDLVAETTKMMLTSAVKRVYEPGSKYDVCVVFIGKQGLGKSTLCERLSHGEKYFADGLKDFGPKAYEIIRGKWIVELAEMKATLSAKSSEEIKQFLAAKRDRHRDIYEKLAKDRPRQCVFLGTANNMECLPYDETGNRRFIPIDCDRKRQEIHPLADENLDAYIDQIWAQALRDYRNGDAVSSLDMRFEEELRRNADAHMTQDSRVGVIQDYLDSQAEGKVCILQIWREALKEDGFPEKKDSRELGNLMDNRIEGWKNTGKTATFKKYGKKCKYWVRTEFNDRDMMIIQGMHGKPEDFMLVDGELRKQDGKKPEQISMEDWTKELEEPSERNVQPGFIVDTIEGRGIVMKGERANGKDEAFVFLPSAGTVSRIPADKVRDTGKRADLTKLFSELDGLL